MGWIRVKIIDKDRFEMPDICPNCLDSPVTENVSLTRSWGVPLVASYSMKGEWPFCTRCASWVTRDRRWQWRFALWPAILLFLIWLAIAMYMSYTNNVGNPAFMWLLLASGAVAVVGTIVCYLVHFFSPCPDTCISNVPTVKPIDHKVFDFEHPIYVEHLLSINPQGVLKINEKKLKKTIAKFESRHHSTRDVD